MPGFYSNISPHLRFERSISGIVTEDTVKLIISTANTYSTQPYIQKVVKVLDQGNPSDEEFLKRLFAVCCKNVEYLRDPSGHEIVFTPKLLMSVGKGDCKKFTTFILSVLKAKGIKADAKVVSYDGFSWAHIYAIVPRGNGYITLDPVNHCRYNSEVDYKKAQVFGLDGSKSNIMTKLSLMGSLGNISPQAAVGAIHRASDDFLGDIDETFGGRRRRLYSRHNPAALAGLGNDYMSGIGDENQMADEYLSGIEELTGEDSDLGKGLLKKAAQNVKAKVQAKAQTVKQNVQKGAQKRQANKAVKKTERQVKRAAKKTPQAKAAKKAQRKKIFKGAKAVGFAPARAAFLALIALGGALSKTPLKINLAGKLALSWQKDNGAKIVKVWEGFGGKREALAKAISKAAKVNISGMGVLVSSNGSFELAGIGVVTAAAAASTIAVAAPITIAMMKLLSGDKEIVSEPEAEFVEDVVDAVEERETKKSGGDPQKTTKRAKETPLVQAGEEIDEGGNQDTQADIIEEEAQEPEPQEGDGEDFKAATVKKSSTPVAKKNTAADGTKTDQGKPDAQQPTQNLPARADQFRTDKNFAGNWRSPFSWLKGYIYAGLLCNIYNVPEFAQAAVGISTLTMLAYTTLLQLKNKYNGKIQLQRTR